MRIYIYIFLHTHTYTRVIRLCSCTLLGNNTYNPFPSSFCIVCFAPSVGGNMSVSTFFLDKLNGSHVLFFVKQVGSQFFKPYLRENKTRTNFKNHGSNVCACVCVYIYIYRICTFISIYHLRRQTVHPKKNKHTGPS